jgi:hypothetical protein
MKSVHFILWQQWELLSGSGPPGRTMESWNAAPSRAFSIFCVHFPRVPGSIVRHCELLWSPTGSAVARHLCSGSAASVKTSGPTSLRSQTVLFKCRHVVSMPSALLDSVQLGSQRKEATSIVSDRKQRTRLAKGWRKYDPVICLAKVRPRSFLPRFQKRSVLERKGR